MNDNKDISTTTNNNNNSSTNVIGIVIDNKLKIIQDISQLFKCYSVERCIDINHSKETPIQQLLSEKLDHNSNWFTNCNNNIVVEKNEKFMVLVYIGLPTTTGSITTSDIEFLSELLSTLIPTIKSMASNATHGVVVCTNSPSPPVGFTRRIEKLLASKLVGSFWCVTDAPPHKRDTFHQILTIIYPNNKLQFSRSKNIQEEINNNNKKLNFINNNKDINIDNNKEIITSTTTTSTTSTATSSTTTTNDSSSISKSLYNIRKDKEIQRNRNLITPLKLSSINNQIEDQDQDKEQSTTPTHSTTTTPTSTTHTLSSYNERLNHFINQKQQNSKSYKQFNNFNNYNQFNLDYEVDVSEYVNNIVKNNNNHDFEYFDYERPKSNSFDDQNSGRQERYDNLLSNVQLPLSHSTSTIDKIIDNCTPLTMFNEYPFLKRTTLIDDEEQGEKEKEEQGEKESKLSNSLENSNRRTLLPSTSKIESIGRKMINQCLKSKSIQSNNSLPYPNVLLPTYLSNSSNGGSGGGSTTTNGSTLTSIYPISTGSVMVVEDNEMNAEFLIKLLEKFGVTNNRCVLVTDGLQAVQTYKTSKTNFSLILMDLFMPRMDGYQATNIIRQIEGGTTNSKRTPIVTVTANVTRGAREKCLSSGFDGYISKPIRADELKNVVDKYVHGVM